jgi:uncharacterized protein (TIGR00369 family)
LTDQSEFLKSILQKQTVHETLGINVEYYDNDKVVLSLEVGPKVHQPMGLLHGGVSCVLAESAASFGAALNLLPEKSAVGIELNASHLKSVTSGKIVATATPVRKGKKIHVWGIEIVDENDNLICISRCTLAVVDLKIIK